VDVPSFYRRLLGISDFPSGIVPRMRWPAAVVNQEANSIMTTHNPEYWRRPSGNFGTKSRLPMIVPDVTVLDVTVLDVTARRTISRYSPLCLAT
jgi:hypothetical protein